MNLSEDFFFSSGSFDDIKKVDFHVSKGHYRNLKKMAMDRGGGMESSSSVGYQKKVLKKVKFLDFFQVLHIVGF